MVFPLQLSPQTTLLINQTAAYSPSYLYGLFPGDSTLEPGDDIPAAPDYSVQARDTYSYGTSASLTHNLTRRNRLTASGDFLYTDYAQQTINQRDMKVAGVGGRFARNVTRNTAVTVGFKYRTGQVGISLGPTQEYLADVGADHSRPLSATRRASVGFRLGMSAVELPRIAAQLFEPTGRRYLANGEFSVSYQFSSVWQAGAMYRRSLEYVPTLVTPVFSDGFSANVDAVFTPRWDLQVSAGYSNGTSAFERESSEALTYTGDVRLRYAVNRKLAGYVQYMYYFYDFQGLRQVVSGIPPTLERHAVTGGPDVVGACVSKGKRCCQEKNIRPRKSSHPDAAQVADPPTVRVWARRRESSCIDRCPCNTARRP